MGGIEVKLFKHIKTGNIYQVLGHPSVKINGTWALGVLYRPVVKTNKNYCRELSDFQKKFEEIKSDQQD